MLAGSAACFVEQNARLPLTVAHIFQIGAKALMGKHEEKRDIIVTYRNAHQIFDLLGLHFVDFTNLKILDAGAGKSRFGQIMNLAYRIKGTHVEGLDYNTTGPFLNWPGHVTRGDAFEMPYNDGTFDLTLNSFMYTYYLPWEFSDGEEGVKEMEKSLKLLNEHIRVTAPGGEVRISLHQKYKSEKAAAFLQFMLKRDPRVDSVEFHYKTFSVATMRIQLRKDADSFSRTALLEIKHPRNPNNCPPVNWKWLGTPSLETAATLGIAFTLAYPYLF